MIRTYIGTGALVLALSGGAVAAELTGSVRLANGKQARQAVVYLEGDQHGVPLEKAVMDQRDRVFIPHVLVVPVGTTVQFPNNDTVFHNVFASFDAKKFDLGLYPRGKTLHQTFTKKGLVALQCNIHASMGAYIYVVDTPYYALTTREGSFSLSGVRPGTYTLRIWHESGEVLRQPITVTATNAALALVLGRA